MRLRSSAVWTPGSLRILMAACRQAAIQYFIRSCHAPRSAAANVRHPPSERHAPAPTAPQALNNLALKYGVTFEIVSSAHSSATVAPGAKPGNHQAGHALDLALVRSTFAYELFTHNAAQLSHSSHHLTVTRIGSTHRLQSEIHSFTVGAKTVLTTGC